MRFNFLKLNSLRFKVTILSIVILGFLLFIYSTFMYVTFRHALYSEMDSQLEIKVKKVHNAVISYVNVLGYDPKAFTFSVNRVVSQTGHHVHGNKIEKLEDMWIRQMRGLNIQDDVVVVLSSKGDVLAESRKLDPGWQPAFQREFRSASRGQTVFKDVRVAGEPSRFILQPVTYKNGQKCVIAVATSRARLIESLNERLIVKAVAIGIILVLVSFLSQLFVRSVMQPVDTIIRAARNINYKDLSIRIKTEGIDVEMKDLAEALNEMMSRLEKSFNYIVEFSAHVSHELKTPLAIIRAESELALRGVHTEEQWRNVVKDNLEEVRQMTHMIEDMLLLTRIEYQPHVFAFEAFELTEFLRELEEPIRLLATEKEITARLKFSGEKMRLRGDKGSTRRLLYNLVNNAIKYTPPQGEIDVSLKRQGREAVLSVSDTGVGISRENLPRIFEKFFRVENPQASDDSGTGLGLSIARSIAHMHGGSIRAESEPGEGSTFIVHLPLL